jgi:protein-tyrosine phosphatase
MLGGRPASEAVQVMSRMDIDLSAHESQPLTELLVRHADMIFTMTRSHRQAIVSEWPEASARVRLLCRDGGDVADPVGAPAEQYQRCAEQMKAELEQWAAEIQL